MVLTAVSPVLAVEYSVQPSVQAQATHEDNIRLTPNDPISLQGTEVVTSLESRAAGETWQAELGLELDFNSYNRSEYDSDDQYIDFNLNKITERQNFGIRTNVVRDSTRTSEIETSGQIGLKAVRRESYTVNPYWSYSLDQVNRVSIEGALYAVDYSGDDSQFTDYDYSTLSASWFSVLSESFTLQVNAVGTSFESDPRPGTATLPVGVFEAGEYDVSTDSVQLQVGGEYTFSEQLSFNALVGTTDTKQQYNVGPANACVSTSIPGGGIYLFTVNVGPILNPDQCFLRDYSDESVTGEVGLSWKGERYTLKADYTIKNEPVSRGYEIQSDKARIIWNYKLSKVNDLGVNFLYGKHEAVDVSATAINADVSNRDFINANVNYRHRLTEDWLVVANAGYRWQDRDAVPGEAESYILRLGVTYKPTRSIWSR